MRDHHLELTALSEQDPSTDQTSAVQYAVVDPNGERTAYGDQAWVKYGGCFDAGNHAGGRIERRSITITYGEWEPWA